MTFITRSLLVAFPLLHSESTHLHFWQSHLSFSCVIWGGGGGGTTHECSRIEIEKWTKKWSYYQRFYNENDNYLCIFQFLIHLIVDYVVLLSPFDFAQILPSILFLRWSAMNKKHDSIFTYTDPYSNQYFKVLVQIFNLDFFVCCW